MADIKMINHIDGDCQNVITIPKDMHEHYSGSYVVTPTKQNQEINCNDKIMDGNISINKIPDNYIDTTDATATAGEILHNKTAYINGEKVIGSMANNGGQISKIDDVNDTIQISEGYHNGDGYVEIDGTEKGKIIPGNIKKGISVLGVDGTYEPITQEKTVKSSTTEQEITPDSGYDGISKVTVQPIITEEKTVKSSLREQEITPAAGKDFISKVIVQAVEVEEKTVKSSNASQTVLPGAGKDFISQVIVQPIITEEKTVKSSLREQEVTPAAGKDYISKVIVQAVEVEEKTVKSSNASQTVLPGAGKDFISQVTVEPIITQEKTVTPTEQIQNITPDNGYDGLNQVQVGAIPSEYIVPDGVKSINDNGDYDVSNFAGVSVSVGDEQFEHCAGEDNTLFDYDLGNIERIRKYAFYQNAGVRSIKGRHVRYIGSNSFTKCTGLTTIDLDDNDFSQIKIDSSAFSECGNLSKIYGFEKISAFEQSCFSQCSKLNIFTIGSGSIVTIGPSAFSGCTSIDDLEFDGYVMFTVQTNSGVSFSGCTNLTSLTFHSGVNFRDTGFQSRLFLNCNKLETVKLHRNVMGNYALSYLPGLKNVYFYDTPSAALGDYLLGGYATFDIWVPWSQGAVGNAPWGAQKATIHYDTVYDDIGDPIV